MKRFSQALFGQARARRMVLARERGFTLSELLVTCAILGIIMAAAATVQMTGATVATIGESKAEAQQSARAAMLMEEDIRLAGFGYPSSQTKFTAASQTAVTFWADLLNASTTLSQPVNPGDRVLNVVSGNLIGTGDMVYVINGDQWESLTVTSTTATTVTVAAGAANAYPVNTQVGRPRLITYSWDGATRRLMRDAGDGNGLQPLADGVQAFQYQFFDTTDTAIVPAALPANLGNIRRMAITMTARSTVSAASDAFTVTSSVRPKNL